MITINSDELYFALSFLKDIVPSNPHQPVHRNVVFEPWQEDILKIHGMDIDKSGYFAIAAELDFDRRKFMLPLDKIHPLISELRRTDDTLKLELTSTGKTVRIVSEDGTSVSFRLEDVEEFPEPTQYTVKKQFEVEPGGFVKGLSMATLAQSDKLILTAVHIEGDGNQIIFEATNMSSGGYRSLSHQGVKFDVAIPATIEKPLKKMVKGASDVWNVFVTDRGLLVEDDHWQVVFRLMESRYPDLSRVYRNACINKIQVDKETLGRELRIMQAVMDTNRMEVEIETGKIIMRVDGELGETERTVEVVGDTENNRIHMNIVELQKVIQLIEGEDFELQVGTNREPVIFKDEDRIYFIIPML